MNQRLNLSKLWEGSRKTCQGLELGSGNPTVQDFRGASGTVRQGENVNPSCSRKSRHGNPSPTARRARFLSQPESPEPRDMGAQVPCRVHAEVPQEVAVWTNQAALGKCIPRACPAQGMPDRERALDARSCAHVDIDSTEVFGVRGDRVFEREELDLDCAERGTQATEFSGSQVLGQRLLRFDRGAGRGDDSRLHQGSRDGGQAARSVATEARVLMKSH